MITFISSLFNDKQYYENVLKPNVKHSINLVKANEKIIRQGDKHTYFFFIKSGSVQVILNEELMDRHPIHTVIAVLNQNDIFGEFRLFDNYPASADVVTAEDSEIVTIDIKSFRAFLDADPFVGYKVYQEMLQILAKRLHQSNQTVMRLMKSAVDFQKQLHQLIKEE